MGRSLDVHLDDAAVRDLRLLQRGGASASDVVRDALRLSARRLRSRRALTAMAAEIDEDPADRHEMEQAQEQTEALTPGATGPACGRAGRDLRAALAGVPPPDDRFAADIADAIEPQTE